jgi:S1-C subfamily serine protease
MNRSFHIRRTTAVLTLVIAALVGALATSVSLTHRAPVTMGTALASTGSDQVPFTTFAPIVKHAMPAVVNISSSKMVKTSGQQTPGLFDDPFFRQFFGGRMPRQEQPRSERAQSLPASLSARMVTSSPTTMWSKVQRT